MNSEKVIAYFNQVVKSKGGECSFATAGDMFNHWCKKSNPAMNGLSPNEMDMVYPEVLDKMIEKRLQN